MYSSSFSDSALERAEITQLSNDELLISLLEKALERAEITQLSNCFFNLCHNAFALERAEITQLSNLKCLISVFPASWTANSYSYYNTHRSLSIIVR